MLWKKQKKKNSLKMKINNNARIRKVVNLTLAFKPSRGMKEIISQKIKESGEADFSLNIEKNSSILGGIILSCDGRYKNLSLKKNMDEFFKKKN